MLESLLSHQLLFLVPLDGAHDRVPNERHYLMILQVILDHRFFNGSYNFLDRLVFTNILFQLLLQVLLNTLIGLKNENTLIYNLNFRVESS